LGTRTHAPYASLPGQEAKNEKKRNTKLNTNHPKGNFFFFLAPLNIIIFLNKKEISGNPCLNTVGPLCKVTAAAHHVS
jgi:hypothetical protein